MNWEKEQYKKESVLVMEKIKGKVMKNKKTILREEKKEEKREKKEKPVDVRKIDNIMVYLNSYILF